MDERPLLCRLDRAGLFLPGDTERRRILKGITWDIRRGDHTVLIGPNGAGKTTLLRLLHGEAWTTEGSIAWAEKNGGLSSSRITGLSVTSLVSPAQQETFQRNAWDISGLELLLTGFDGTPFLYSHAEPARRRLAERMAEELDAVNLLARNIRELSQGQLRLLLLGRAMVRRPSLLLLDECTDGLDARHRLLFGQALRRLSAESTVILTTHRESMLPDWMRSRIYISDGVLFPRPPAEAELPAAEQAERAHASGVPVTPPASDRPLVELEHASVYLRGKKVLHDICWSLRQGENWVLEGGNGSGKSTFLRMLAGDEQVAWPGVIRFSLPEPSARDIPFVTLRRRVRLISDQTQSLYEYDVSCLELVLSGFDNTVGLYRDFSDAEKAEAMRQLARVGLAGLADFSIRRVSTGQLRRIFLARALLGAPCLLLLDEVCTGLDVQGRQDFLDVLDRLTDEGLSYVFVSHYREDEPATVNRRARMREGRLEILS